MTCPTAHCNCTQAWRRRQHPAYQDGLTAGTGALEFVAVDPDLLDARSGRNVYADPESCC